MQFHVGSKFDLEFHYWQNKGLGFMSLKNGLRSLEKTLDPLNPRPLSPNKLGEEKK